VAATKTEKMSSPYNPDIERPLPDGEVRSYRTLRRIVGVLGVSLPIVLAAWGFVLQGKFTVEPSISDYYYPLRTRDALVGVLFTVGWFLWDYHGYDKSDDVPGNFACLFALGVALFPKSGPYASPTLHFTSAAGLFLILAYFAYFQFTKSAGRRTPEKKTRDRIYRTCGVAIVACMVLIVIYHLLFENTRLAALAPVFWLETFALWAFGFSWFVKGDTLFKDKEPSIESLTAKPTT